MIELNLLPDVKKEFIKAQKTRNAIIGGAILVTIVAGGLVALLAMSVYGLQAVAKQSLEKDIKKNFQALQDKPEINKYLTVQNQLEKIDTLHSSKYAYERALDYLRALNPSAPNTISLASADFLKEENKVHLEGMATSFESINTYKNTLQNAELTYSSDNEKKTVKLFSDVQLEDASIATVNNEKVASFKITATYIQEAFINTTKDVSVKVPNQVISDGDKNAPKQIFTDATRNTQGENQ